MSTPVIASPSRYNVSSLAEFYECIQQIYKEQFSTPGGTLWFRGQAYTDYTLMPSLFRDEKELRVNQNNTYSQGTCREEYYYQSFRARSTHVVQSTVKNRIEWQEVFQHHHGATRLLDWSESAQTALNFACEAFLDTQTNLHLVNERQNLSPVVWVLKPQALNSIVYESLREICKTDIYQKILKDEIGDEGVTELMKQLAYKDIYFSSDGYQNCTKGSANTPKDISNAGLPSLCVLEDYRTQIGYKLNQMVATGEFNPFFYLALRFYADGLPVSIDVSQLHHILPPLAILQPYHSERIRAQRGTFTAFPAYVLTSSANYLRKYCYDMRAMERQSQIANTISRIHIIDPKKVSREMIAAGERQSELYPDIDTYAVQTRTQKFYL